MTEAAPAAPAPADTYPGKGLGIAGIILAILLPVIGLIVSIIANSQSKKAGFKNGPAKAGIIVGIILTVLGALMMILFGSAIAAMFGGLAQVCQDLGPGVWEVNGVTYTCN